MPNDDELKCPCCSEFRSLLLEIAACIDRQVVLADPKQGFKEPGSAGVSSAIRKVIDGWVQVTPVIVEE